MGFLPNDYQKPPNESAYMKLEEGKNRFRVLSDATVGYELWIDRKPIRKVNSSDFTSEQLGISDINSYTGKRSVPKHFWAFAVYNYKEKKIMILQIKQKTIQDSILSLIDDPEWGSPLEYDMEVAKVVEDKKTTYSVVPKPHKPVEEAVKKEYEGMNIKLQALFDGGDPFNSETVNPKDISF